VSGLVLPPECESVLLSESEIQRRVAELGAQIAEDFAGDEDVRFITVLKGGLFFLADLARATELPLSIDFMAVSPYEIGVGGKVRVTKDLSDDIEGASVVLVEDVVDTGLTVNYVVSLLQAHDPAKLVVCSLLDKPHRRIADVPIEYRGFTLPDRFVVGYGLDLRGRYRNLNCIATLHDDAVFT
jgi:hypoxanthine phosphoribosyltransferase